MAFLKNQKNPQHRKFGKILVLIGRAIAAFGWILGGNEQNAMIVAVVSGVIFILSLLLKDGGKKEEVREGNNSRPRSPKGKRE